MNDSTAQNQDPKHAQSYVDDYAPPHNDSVKNADSTASSSLNASDSSASTLQELEDLESQNIFVMLGAESGTDAVKESFLEQLQDVIWNDFLENDVELLLTTDEQKKVAEFRQRIADSTGKSQDEAKDELVEYIESLIPDLEDIMLDKALELKGDLFVERIKGMREYYADSQDALTRITEAEEHMHAERWATASQILNGL